MEPFLISVLLALAQGEAPPPELKPLPFDDGWQVAREKPAPAVVQAGDKADVPPAKPAPPSPSAGATSLLPDAAVLLHRPKEDAAANGEPKPVEIAAPLIPPAPPKPPEPAPAAKPAAPDRWALMTALQGTSYGKCLDDHRMYLYGWFSGSYTASTAEENNSPITWNDRPNNFLFQQAWLKFGKSVVTTAVDPTCGFHVDILYGTDYRYTLPRGLWNSQLLNSKWDPTTDPFGSNFQNLYGVDSPQHYLNLYVPNLFRGTEFRVGRFYTPWGVESIEIPSTPLISRSYAFNWCPPFTHCGVAAYITFSPEWSAVLMGVNGNDVYFGDPSEEPRFVGNIKWTQPCGGRGVQGVEPGTLATSIGRGKFNAGDPFAVPGVALSNEPLGRNNMNAFDFVWTHTFSSRLSYNLEGIYAYQTNAPAFLKGTLVNDDKTVHWASLAHYLFYTICPEVSGVMRFETFEDFQGQRTGFDALYTSATAGLVYKMRKDVILRSEVRYDIANRGRPFNNGNDNQILTGAVDFIIRW